MEIKETKISIRQLTEGYADRQEAGVKAYGGLLDVRPPYQREFVYNDKEREAVIDTVTKGYPLNVMYWSVRETPQDGGKQGDTPTTYEIIDGQQRTISICQYVNGDFAYDFNYFGNLPADRQKQILDYELCVYLCRGTDSEKLKWFQTINIAGKQLKPQELLNAVYASAWLSDAKRYFSKSNCGAYLLGNKYVQGSPIQQDYLETVLRWISGNKIEDYMARHSLKDTDAGALWYYFQQVIGWVQTTFVKYRREMKGVDWGAIYNKYHTTPVNPNAIEAEVARLMEDSDVENKKGIFWYVFDGDEHRLGIRAFDQNTRREVYERQQGVCKICGKHFEIEDMEADHITPWARGGRTVAENCQMLCRECNRRKSAR